MGRPSSSSSFFSSSGLICAPLQPIVSTFDTARSVETPKPLPRVDYHKNHVPDTLSYYSSSPLAVPTVDSFFSDSNYILDIRPPSSSSNYNNSLKQQHSTTSSISSTSSSSHSSFINNDIMFADFDLQVVSDFEVRRRRLAKLRRTLGENIPVELISPGAAKESMHAFKPVRKEMHKRGKSIKEKMLRRATVSFSATSEKKELPPLPKNPRPQPSSVISPFSESYDDTPLSPLSPIEFVVPSPTHDIVLDALNDFPPRSSSLRKHKSIGADIVHHQHSGRPVSRSSTLGHKNKLSKEMRTPSIDLPPVYPRPDTPFMDHLVPLNSNVAPSSWLSPTSHVRSERRQGWSGEWNQTDIQDVISKLRTLK